MLHKLPKFLTSVLSCQPQVHVWHTCLLWLTHHFISCFLYRFIFLRTLSSSLFLSVYPCLFLVCISSLLISVILSLSPSVSSLLSLPVYNVSIYLSIYNVSIYLSSYLQCIYLSVYLFCFSFSNSFPVVFSVKCQFIIRPKAPFRIVPQIFR